MATERKGAALVAAGWGLLAVGVAVAVAGFVVGIMAVHGGGLSCGSALAPRHRAADVADLSRGLLGLPAQHVCAAPLHDRRVLTFSLLGGGGGLALLSVAGLLVPGYVARRDSGHAKSRPAALTR